MLRQYSRVFCTCAGDTLLQASRVLPLLLQTVEKTSKMPGQSQLVTEMLSASRILVRLASVDIDAGWHEPFLLFTLLFNSVWLEFLSLIFHPLLVVLKV